MFAQSWVPIWCFYLSS